MLELPSEVLEAFGVVERGVVASGHVFELLAPFAYYFSSTKARPGVVVRVQRTAEGDPVLAWLLYTTTKAVPARFAIELSAGEGALREDCRIDLRTHKEIAVSDLIGSCARIGTLGGERMAEVEELLPSSQLSERVRGLGP